MLVFCEADVQNATAIDEKHMQKIYAIFEQNVCESVKSVRTFSTLMCLKTTYVCATNFKLLEM